MAITFVENVLHLWVYYIKCYLCGLLRLRALLHWQALHSPTKGAHTCAGAQDADILPRLSLVHSQSRITSALNSSARCFTEGELPFMFVHVPTRLYDTTID